MVKEIGFDLVKAEKLANDINYRRLLNIVMLYLTIVLLFISICLVLYYKLRHSWFAAPHDNTSVSLWSILPSFSHKQESIPK